MSGPTTAAGWAQAGGLSDIEAVPTGLPLAPTEVLDLTQRLGSLAERFRVTQQSIIDLRASAGAALAADTDDYGRAMIDNKPDPGPTHRLAHDEALASSQREADAVTRAQEITQGELADAIRKAATKWTADLAAERASSIAHAEDLLDDLARTLQGLGQNAATTELVEAAQVGRLRYRPGMSVLPESDTGRALASLRALLK
jgi:hypothetical protein